MFNLYFCKVLLALFNKSVNHLHPYLSRYLHTWQNAYMISYKGSFFSPPAQTIIMYATQK